MYFCSIVTRPYLYTAIIIVPKNYSVKPFNNSEQIIEHALVSNKEYLKTHSHSIDIDFDEFDGTLITFPINFLNSAIFTNDFQVRRRLQTLLSIVSLVI